MRNIAHTKAKIVDVMVFFPFFALRTGRKWFGRWQKNYMLAEKELASLPDILAKDSIVFDIGANRGELAYFFATQCGAAKVYAFEPQKRMFNVLRGVASMQKNILPFNIALSDSAGQKTIHIPLKDTGRYTQAASFEASKEPSLADEQVNVQTLDGFVTERGVTQLDFIKCDTEGHELSVFKGAIKTLKSLKPILYIEIKKSNEVEMLALLKSLGYATPVQQATGSENYYFYPAK